MIVRLHVLTNILQVPSNPISPYAWNSLVTKVAFTRLCLPAATQRQLIGYSIGCLHASATMIHNME